MSESVNKSEQHNFVFAQPFPKSEHFVFECQEGPLQPNEIYVLEFSISEQMWVENEKYDPDCLGFGCPSRIKEGGRYNRHYWTSCRDEKSLAALKKQMDAMVIKEALDDPKIKEQYREYVPYKRKLCWHISKKHFFQAK